jgi:hypothetical protein
MSTSMHGQARRPECSSPCGPMKQATDLPCVPSMRTGMHPCKAGSPCASSAEGRQRSKAEEPAKTTSMAAPETQAVAGDHAVLLAGLKTKLS